MINDIPYFSQWDGSANKTRDDCGPSCIAMILDSYGELLTVNDVFDKTGAAPDYYISFDQMYKAIRSYGYTFDVMYDQSPEGLRFLLDKGQTPIALIHYEFLSSRQDNGFKGPHFVVVTGYDENGYYVNDPDFWGSFRDDGHNHFYKKDEFEKSWGSCHIDLNPDNSLIVIKNKNIVTNMTEQDKKDIESMRNLRTYSPVWYTDKEVVGDYKKLLDERDKLNIAINDKNNVIQTMEINFDNQLAKNKSDCQKDKELERVTLMNEFATKEKALNDEIEELKKNGETKTVYIETPLTERFRGKSFSEKLKALIDIFS